MPQRNERRFVPGVTLWVLIMLGLVCCDSAPPPQAGLLTSTTYTELAGGRPLRVPLQLPPQPVLIEIRGRNLNFRSRVLDASGQAGSDIHLAFLRSAPVFHFVDAASQQTKYSLELTPLQTNRLASVNVNILVLPDGSRKDRALTAAWRKLARGLQFVDGELPADWAENLAALRAARQQFDQLGLAEPALWARYFSAYFEYYPLYSYAEALEEANALISRAEESAVPELALLSHELAGQILIERDAGEDEAQARQVLELAQQHFTRARQLSEATDNVFETIWAINNAGITFFYQDKTSDALSRYAEAVNLAINVHDSYLTNLIGINMAVAQEKYGHINEAIQTLLRIQREQSMHDDPVEIEHVFSLLGFDYLKLNQIPEALDALNQALDLSIKHDWIENRGRNRLLLAQVYRELGQPDKSLAFLQLAIPDLETARDRRGMRRAMSLSADINRGNHQFADMARDRARQEHFLETDLVRADWLRSSALDAAAEANIELAINLYRHSAKAYATSSFGHLAQLSELNACVLEVRLHAAPSCSTARLQPSYDAIQSMQASTSALEGKFLWAQLQALAGRRETAQDLMASLVEDIAFYRRSLPGILGAWYWDARRQIFDFYMDLVLDATSSPEQSAAQSLLALDQLRNADLHPLQADSAKPATGVEHPASTAIRALMAQRDQAESEHGRVAAQRGIDQLLVAGAERARKESGRLNITDWRRQLRRLPEDWSVLTFYFTGRKAWAWAGNRLGLKRYELGPGPELQELIGRTKANIRTVNHASLETELAQLGERLLAPLKDDMRDKILFMGAGALSDFPLEALVLDGQPLIRRHQVVNIMSANDLDWPAEQVGRSLKPASIFIAGDPQSPASDLPQLRGAASELAAIQASFPNAAIARYQGKDLVRGVFTSASFSEADLIHIASHAIVDREYPELSRLFLSASNTQASEFLTPNDLQYQPVTARLVVLSACSTVGLNRFEYDNNLGFVSRFLQQGSGLVIASLWPIPDRTTALFLAEFYKQLAAGTDVAGALRQTKLTLLDSGPSGNIQWSSLQLFSR